MAVSKEELSARFDTGVAKGATHMLVVCDTWDYEDFAVYVDAGTAVVAVYAEWQAKTGYRVMEVYDLRQSKAAQLAEVRAFHLEP